MAMTMFWMRTEIMKEAKMLAMMPMLLAFFSDGDNGDDDNLDGIVNSNGGNDSNYVGNPPDSGDTVGEKNESENRTAI